MKFCHKCKVEKPVTDFSKNKSNKDGFQTWCKFCSSNYTRQYQRDNKEKINTKNREWSKNNPERRNATAKKYYKKNKKTIIKKNINYAIKKYHSNINFRIRMNIAGRINDALKRVNAKKIYGSLEYLGMSIVDFKKHLEKQFYPNSKTGEIMTWENRNKWHIDHIIPCSSYNLREPDAQKKCFHYSNLRPLWAEDNMKKGNKLNYEME